MCEHCRRVHRVVCSRVLTDWKYKLNTSHRLPANGIPHVCERFVDSGSKDGACIQEQLERDDDKAAERRGDNFGLVGTASRCQHYWSASFQARMGRT